MNDALVFIWRHADALLVIAPMLVGVLLTVAPAGRVTTAAAIAVSSAVAALAVALVVRLLSGAPPGSVDAMGAGACAVIAIVAAASFIASAQLAADAYARRLQPMALGLGLVAVGAACGAALEHDAVRIVFLLQAALLAGAALTGLSAGRERRAAAAGFGAVVIALGGGALAIVGAALLHAATGALDLVHIAGRVMTPGDDHGAWLGAAMMLCGLAAMAGLAPLHAVSAESAARTAHALAPLVAIVVRVAALIALIRVYGVTQLIAAPGVAEAFAYALAALGAVGVVAGALQAIGASEVRRLAAHALTAQFGCALIGLAAGGDDGAIAALFVVAAGAMTALAIIVGAAAARSGHGASAPMATLDGLGRTHPAIAAAIAVAALGMTGAPLTAAFLGKWLSIEAALARGWYWAAAAIVASSFAAVFVTGQVVERLYFRSRAPSLGAPARGVIAFAPALAVSVLATLVFGWSASAPLDAARMAAGVLAPARSVAP